MSEKVEFWGIDGCRAGWFCAGLRADDELRHFVAPDISAVCAILCQFRAKIALIDIPIGLSDGGYWRDCEKAAREFIGDRKSSVFATPCRPAVDAYTKEDGDITAKKRAGRNVSIEITGKSLSEQTLAIVPKIAEVDSFLRKDSKARELFREVHPEVCFRAFKGAPLSHGKSDPAGKTERKEILQKYPPNVDWIKIRNTLRGEGYTKSTKQKGVADDDILDAVAAAITAKYGFGRYKTLPENPPKDSRGLRMEMVYSEA